jgi:antitoxin MazE
MSTESIISKWGNSSALRLPAKVMQSLELNTNDKVFLEVEDGRLTVTKAPTPKKGTIEYLFKDYSGESFKTELINPEKPAGKEQW